MTEEILTARSPKKRKPPGKIARAIASWAGEVRSDPFPVVGFTVVIFAVIALLAWLIVYLAIVFTLIFFIVVGSIAFTILLVYFFYRYGMKIKAQIESGL